MTLAIEVDHILDAKGLACPMPIVRTKKAVNNLKPGEVLEVQATDQGSEADIKAWATSSGHHYLGTVTEGDLLKHYIRKASEPEIVEEKSFPHVINNDELLEKANSNKDITIIDVREPAEYKFSHIPGSLSIPFNELESRLTEFDKNGEIFIICRSGNRSNFACQLMEKQGFSNVKNVIQGMVQWSGPTEKI